MARSSGYFKRMPLAVWATIALLSVALLAGSLWWALRPHATVRPMSVESSLSDALARDAAESTVRAWMSALNARHVPNLTALSCGDKQREYPIPFSAEDPDPQIKHIDAISTGRFERSGDVWKLPVFYRSPGAGYGGRVFTFSVASNELRICDIAPPEPW